MYVNRLNFISSAHPIGFKCFAFILDIKNPSRALLLPSLSGLISSSESIT